MDRWEKNLDRVIERVLAGDEYGAVDSGLRSTSDSDLTETGQSCSNNATCESQEQEEKRVFEEMCALLDNTLHLTVHTIMSARGDKDHHRDSRYCAAVDSVWRSQNETSDPNTCDRDNSQCSEDKNNSDDEDGEEDEDDNWRDLYVMRASNTSLMSPRSPTLSSPTLSSPAVSSSASSSSHKASPPPSMTNIELCLSKKRIEDLEMENKLLRDEIVRLHHILGGAIPSADISSGPILQTVEKVGDGEIDKVQGALLAELIETKCALAAALSNFEEEKLKRFKIMRAVDKLLV